MYSLCVVRFMFLVVSVFKERMAKFLLMYRPIPGNAILCCCHGACKASRPVKSKPFQASKSCANGLGVADIVMEANISDKSELPPHLEDIAFGLSKGSSNDENEFSGLKARLLSLQVVDIRSVASGYLAIRLTMAGRKNEMV